MRFSSAFKRIVLLIAFFSIIGVVNAQDTAMYFFRNIASGCRLVQTVDSADFIRVITPSESSEKFVNVNEYFKNGKLKFKAIGIAESFRKSKGLVSYQGSCIDFFPSGKRRVIANFKDGQKDGLEYFYYPDGKLYLVINHKEIKQYASHESFIADCYDRNGNQICKDGKGQVIEYNNEYNDIISGPVDKGKREGEWNGTFFGPDTIKYKFIYKKDVLKSGVGYDKLGNVYPFKDSYNTAKPKKGYYDFIIDFKRNIKMPKNSGVSKAMIDSATIVFIVGKEGFLKEFETFKPVPAELMSVLKMIFDKCEKWEPTSIYGVPMETKVAFSLNVTSYPNSNHMRINFSIAPLHNGIPVETYLY